MRSERLVRSIVSKQKESLSCAGLSQGSKLVVAVSGGADSSTLLDSLTQIRKDCGLELFAAHFNHGLYGESEQISQQVAEFLSGYGLPFTVGKAEVLTLKREWKLSEEAAARKARYQFLFHQATAFRADAIALGHTFDDQTETVLMNLIRGAGIYGLAGMRLISRQKMVKGQPPINLFRPLLNVTKRQTEQYCQLRGIQPVFDQSNLNLQYTRNRLRRELIPMLETYNPSIKQSLIRLGATCRDLVDHLNLEASMLMPWTASFDSQQVTLNLEELSRLDRPIQVHLLRLIIEVLKGDLNRINYYHLTKILEILGKPGKKQLPLPGGGIVHKERNTATVTFDQG